MKKRSEVFKSMLKVAMATSLIIGASSCKKDEPEPPTTEPPTPTTEIDFEGAVYAMTNGLQYNSVVGYGRESDGTLTLLGEYSTGGKGSDAFDGAEGLDPLISAYALTITSDNRFVLAANAGSNTISVLRIEADYSLTVVDQESTGGVGPNSIAVNSDNSVVYVANIAQAGVPFTGEPDQEGSFYGFNLSSNGDLTLIPGSGRNLGNRPSAIQFSPNDEFLVVTSINSGSATLGSGSEDEVVVYSVDGGGVTSATATGAATSTLRDNTEGRNLPSAIGFQVVGDNYVVVTEAREFQPDGTPPAFPALQSGSVSTWQIQSDGSLTAIDLDVPTGADGEGRTACWLDFNADESVFWVSNAIEASLSAFSFSNGDVENLGVSATGTGTLGAGAPEAFANTDGWIDLWIAGDFLYQLYGLDGTIGVYRISGNSLTLVEELSGDLPLEDTQGIVAF